MGSSDPLPTTIEEGVEGEGGWEERRLQEVEVMWLLASESMYHSANGSGVREVVLNATVRAFWSHTMLGGAGAQSRNW
jgi:hypothetical protein